MQSLVPQDLHNICTVGEAELSPDGKYIIYTVQTLEQDNEKPKTDIYLAATGSDEIRRLTFSGQESNPHFSPDGKRIAFSSGRSSKGQIFILELSGGEAWQLPTSQAVSSFEWGPDGKSIFYTAKVFSKPDAWTPYPGAPDYDGKRLEQIANKVHQEKQDQDKANNVRVITSFRYRVDGQGYVGENCTHIFVTPVPEQAPVEALKPQGRQITSGDWNHGSFSVSPDGKFIAVSSRHSDTPDLDYKQDLWIYEVESGHKHLLFDAPGPTSSPHWSLCGRYLAFTGHSMPFGQSSTTHLWLLNMSKSLTGEGIVSQSAKDVIPITLPLDRPVGAYAGAELRLGGGSTMFWKGDDLYFLLTDKGVPGIYKTDMSGNVSPVLVEKNRAITSVHGVNDILIYTASSPNQPEELYVNIQGQEQPVAKVNAKFLSSVAMGDWEALTYTSDDGQEIEGWVIYPVGFQPSKKYPLLLLIHGGPHGAYGPAFMFLGQQFAGKGYLVLFTNPRGSETYGQEFACCIDGNWGDRDYADIMAGVDALIDKEIVDETNMFAHGWSYGGYMSCWIATQTDRFKAICAGANVTNLLSDYGTADITLSDEWEYGGQPWKDAVHLMHHSPLQHVENVRTPLLLMHGENDMRCPPGQTEEFYIALKRLGKDVVMIRYPNEFHGLRRPLHRVDRYQRIISYFDFHRSN